MCFELRFQEWKQICFDPFMWPGTYFVRVSDIIRDCRLFQEGTRGPVLLARLALTSTNRNRVQRSPKTDQESLKVYEGRRNRKKKRAVTNWFAPRNPDCAFGEVKNGTDCFIQFDFAVSAGLCSPSFFSLNCHPPPSPTPSRKRALECLNPWTRLSLGTLSIKAYRGFYYTCFEVKLF